MSDWLLSQKYGQPKWRARVKPNDRSFMFESGMVVGNLWELKQALLTVEEDVVRHHVRKESHDVANWVEFVVGDIDLAEELKKYTHRWGMIVALERQMMRTLALPDYVANRWLAKVDSVFTFSDGRRVASLEELAGALAEVSDDEIAVHFERSPNDISVWIEDTVGDYELAEMLEEAVNRGQMKRFVVDHLVKLKSAAEC